jgi:AcrR family transcriptional regulator
MRRVSGVKIAYETSNISTMVSGPKSKGKTRPRRSPTAIDVQSGSAIRRMAVQKRSQATVAVILETAGRMFDDLGIELTTVEAIARNARISNGAVYQYFDNKQDLVEAVGKEWRTKSDAVFAELFTAENLARSADEFVGDFLSRFKSLLGQIPGGRAMLVFSVSSTIPAAHDDLWTQYLERFVARHAPGISAARRLAVAKHYQIVSGALMTSLARSGDQFDRQLVEAQAVLVGYIREVARTTR